MGTPIGTVMSRLHADGGACRSCWPTTPASAASSAPEPVEGRAAREQRRPGAGEPIEINSCDDVLSHVFEFLDHETGTSAAR